MFGKLYPLGILAFIFLPNIFWHAQWDNKIFVFEIMPPKRNQTIDKGIQGVDAQSDIAPVLEGVVEDVSDNPLTGSQ